MKAAAQRIDDLRACLWGVQKADDKPTCARPTLPGRKYCHKHQGQLDRWRRRRAKGKFARRARRLNRRTS